MPTPVAASVVTVGVPAVVSNECSAEVRLVSLTVVRVMTSLTVYEVEASRPVRLLVIVSSEYPLLSYAVPKFAYVPPAVSLYWSCADAVESRVFGKKSQEMLALL